MKIVISDEKLNYEYYNVPSEVAKALITILNECANIVTAESEDKE